MTSPALHRRLHMKITVIKKATVNAKPQGFCGAFVDEGLLTKR
jgi:hypothetical protein